MKQEIEIEMDDTEVDEYDDYQYEMSNHIAHSFIDEQVLPAVKEFDYNNPNEDYVPGVASFGLFYKLVESLLVDGFSPEQLKEVIDDFEVMVIEDNQIH